MRSPYTVPSETKVGQGIGPVSATMRTMTTPAVLAFDRVIVRYGRHIVLNSVSASFAGGEVVAVRGANGSGKTTLLRMSVNAFKPNSGHRVGPARSAYVPATVSPPSLTAGAWLKALPRSTRADPNGALERLGFDGNLDASCRTLSFGNLRKLLLAEALTSGEQLIVIDEVSAGLDDRGLEGLENMIRELKGQRRAIILADQQSRPIPGADRTIRISDGALEEAAGHDQVTEMTLRGPQERVTELVEEAAELGFVPVTRRPR